MKKSKDEKNEAFNKIVKCIMSCKTIEQVESCYKMINLYNNLFSEHKFDIKSEVDVLTEELQKIENKIK
jgi:hypothetical protein